MAAFKLLTYDFLSVHVFRTTCILQLSDDRYMGGALKGFVVRHMNGTWLKSMYTTGESIGRTQSEFALK